MPKVYLLSDYGEHGSENVIATLDRTKVPDLLQVFFGHHHLDYVGPHGDGRLHPTAHEKLAELLAADIPSKYGTNLSFGWGGVQLHIIELKE